LLPVKTEDGLTRLLSIVLGSTTTSSGICLLLLLLLLVIVVIVVIIGFWLAQLGRDLIISIRGYMKAVKNI
jgi:hypothetical protein